MRNFSLDRNSPNAFVLIPHSAFSKEKPIKDQVWKLNLDCTDPHPFCLTTTYGLRAKSMRLFPNLIHENRRISKPEDFSLLPRVIEYSPSSIFLEVEYRNQISLLFTCFFLDPEIMVGNLQLKNLKEIETEITLQLALNLVPMGKGQPSHPDKVGNNQFITGQTDQLEPVLFMTGGPTAISNPFPALSIQLGLQPTSAQQLAWTLVSKESKSQSFDRAKKILTSNWQDKLRVHAMRHAGQTVGIKTGDTNWDSAFFLSQVNAKTHLKEDEKEPDTPHFIKIRLPDFSSISDNLDTKTKVLTNLELNHLCQVFLPAEIDVAIHLLEDQIQKQVANLEKSPENNNHIYETFYKGCPLLASILLEIYELNQDSTLLKRNFPNLCNLYQSWVFDPISKTDAENLHWESPNQLQIDSGLFSFDIWESYSRGLDIKKVESPALYAILLKEAKALSKISKFLGERSQMRYFNQRAKEYQQKLEDCWQEKICLYGYQDIDTHLCTTGEIVFQGYISNEVEINQSFAKPQRLHCHIFASDEHTRASRIKIKGKSTKGDAIEESFKSPGLLWVSGRAHLTTENLYQELETISFEGLNLQDEFILETTDLTQTDISCLLPFWADGGMEKHLQEVTSTLLDPQSSLLSFGIPETWKGQHPLPENLHLQVNVLWNTLILEGLVNNGESKKAAELFTNMMLGIVHGLKDYDGFYPLFDSKTGQPVGQYNSISGLVPIRLFLKIAGIKLLSPTKVALWESNPFPWPIEISWRGLSIWKEQEHTRITFPNGAAAEHNSEKPVIITAE
jgi:hypothetical protein